MIPLVEPTAFKGDDRKIDLLAAASPSTLHVLPAVTVDGGVSSGGPADGCLTALALRASSSRTTRDDLAALGVNPGEDCDGEDVSEG